jgi:hypothetical protein
LKEEEIKRKVNPDITVCNTGKSFHEDNEKHHSNFTSSFQNDVTVYLLLAAGYTSTQKPS